MRTYRCTMRPMTKEIIILFSLHKVGYHFSAALEFLGMNTSERHILKTRAREIKTHFVFSVNTRVHNVDAGALSCGIIVDICI